MLCTEKIVLQVGEGEGTGEEALQQVKRAGWSRGRGGGRMGQGGEGVGTGAEQGGAEKQGGVGGRRGQGRREKPPETGGGLGGEAGERGESVSRNCAWAEEEGEDNMGGVERGP